MKINCLVVFAKTCRKEGQRVGGREEKKGERRKEKEICGERRREMLEESIREETEKRKIRVLCVCVCVCVCVCGCAMG